MKEQVILFEGVDGEELTATEEIVRLFKENDFGSRTGMIGCALSHLRIWEKISHFPDDHVVMVCEDDAFFEEEFMDHWETKIHPYLNMIELIYLGAPIEHDGFYYVLKENIEKAVERGFTEVINKGGESLRYWRTHCYVLKGKTAKLMYNRCLKDYLNHNLNKLK